MYTYTQLMVIIWVLWSLGLATTIARIILRFKVQGKLQAEDYFALLAFGYLTGLTAVVVSAAPTWEMIQTYLLATVQNPLTPLPLPAGELAARTITALKLMFAQMLLFWSTLWAGKFSLLVLFRQMVIGIPKYLHMWWAVFTLVLLTYLACMLSNFLTCVPLSKYWSAEGCSAPDDLRRSNASIKFATAADVVADILIMLLPLLLLAKLRISLKQKLGLACLFSLGIIVVVFAFVRLVNVQKATAQSQIGVTTMADSPIILSLWSTIEAAVAVIVANLPGFRTLLRSRDNTDSSSWKNERSPDYRNTTEPKGTSSRSAIMGRRDMELHSLHSFADEIDLMSRARVRDVERGREGTLS